MPVTSARRIAWLLALAVAGAGGACQRRSAAIQVVEPREAFGLLRNDFAVLVDVREDAERAEPAPDGARAFARSEISAGSASWRQFLDGVPADKQLVLVAAEESHSRSVAEPLAAAGRRVAVLAGGGVRAWKDAGLPLKR